MSVLTTASVTATMEPALCLCGCGGRAPLARSTNRRLGHVKGEPVKYIRGHATKGKRMPREAVARTAAANRGQKRTEEQRRRISEAKRARGGGEQEPPFCACGCRQQVTSHRNRYLHGHNSRTKEMRLAAAERGRTRENLCRLEAIRRERSSECEKRKALRPRTAALRPRRRRRRSHLRGAASPSWRGGRTVNVYGYVLVKDHESPMADGRGYVLEHRWVMARHLGRPLASQEVVHHVRGKTDNRIEDLRLFGSQRDHIHWHALERSGRLLEKPMLPLPVPTRPLT